MSGLVLSGMDAGCAGIRNCHSELCKLGSALGLRYRCCFAAKIGFAEAPPSRPCPSKGNGLTWHSTQSGLWLCARRKGNGLTWHSTQSGLWLRRSPCASAMLKQGKRLGMALGLTGAVASPRQRRCKSRPWPNLFGNGRNAARFRCNQSSSKVGFAEAPPSRPCHGLTWHSTQSGLWLCARLALSLHRFWGKCNRECQQYWKHLKPVTGLR